MASYYVWSGATGSANGSSWANAYTKLATALGGSAAGDTYYVAHDHSETTAGNVNLFAAGTVANPNKIICVNRSGSVPPVSADLRATAQVASTGDFQIQFSIGSAWYIGIIFVAGNATGAANISPQTAGPHWTRFENCSLRIGSTGTGRILHSTQGTSFELINTTVSFSNVAQNIAFAAPFKWRNTASALIGTQVPTVLCVPASAISAAVEFIGVDFSAAGSGKTICGATASSDTRYNLIDCKLNASVTKSTLPTMTSSLVDIIRSGSTGINYAVFRHTILGTLDHETTIVRTGGATDGTTSIAWKIITTASASYSLPFECPVIAIWSDTIGSAVTATVEGIWGGGAVPNDDDIWIEVEYLGDASSPQGSFVNDGKANLLATAAGQTSSSETWGGSTTKFKLGIAFTAQQKGWIYCRVKCAKASSTFYIDPLITLT